METNEIEFTGTSKENHNRTEKSAILGTCRNTEM